MSLHVAIPSQFEALIRQKVASGEYGSVDEIVSVAMQLFAACDREAGQHQADLRRDIAAGLASGPATPWNLAEIKDAGRALRQQRHQSVP